MLVSSDFHIPLFSSVYPGNHNDPTMFAGVVDELVARYKLFAKECDDITLVFDGGNPSTENMKIVSKSDYNFITSLTLTSHKDLLEIPLTGFKTFSDPRLQGTSAHRAKKVVWGAERAIVVTRSEKLLAGQLAGINASLKKKRAELRNLAGKLRRSQMPGAKGKGYTQESLKKRLDVITTGQYISEILKIEITKARGRLEFRYWTDVPAFKKLEQTRLGKRILCSNNVLWTTEEIIFGSRAQSCIENAFRDMKDPHWISATPAFHWTDQKLRVHFFYCVISLTLTSLLLRKAANANQKISMQELYGQLTDVVEVVNLYPSSAKGGKCRAEYVLSERSPLQEKLCKLFNVYNLSRAQAS